MVSPTGNVSRKQALDVVRKTLKLPKTDFPMRANAKTREPVLSKQCMTKLYKWQESSRRDAPLFILHDGPPFANGGLHMGHFLNKILKDIINRYKLMQGFRIEYKPGWDCHGLPIEHKALTTLKKKQKKNKQLRVSSALSATDVRRISSELASSAIVDQAQDFQKWAVLADWENPDGVYRTMDYEYEALQYKVFCQMVKDKLIYRGYKPVYWSPSSQTALAESELEYVDNHVSKSAYIAFDIAPKSSIATDFPKLQAIIWTTTPWTIPSNMALCVNPIMTYCVLQSNECQQFLLAADLVADFVSKNEKFSNYEIVRTDITGAELEGTCFIHPLNSSQSSCIILGDHVTTDAGTGIVHTAPGHGQEDYQVWMKQQKQKTHSGEDIVCPVNDYGKFSNAVYPSSLSGLNVLTDGNAAVLKLLIESGALLSASDMTHRYPYDWRTKKPIIFRSTRQWFAKLSGLHTKARDAITKVNMIPSTSRSRLEATLASRTEWCISRQRAWGLPIPVFYNTEDEEDYLMTEESITHVQEIIRKNGSDAWFNKDTSELLPPGTPNSEKYEKGTDTMDVWFDSGTSWNGVLKGNATADVYLEGSDQHRGWFQSSLLTSMAMRNEAPYKNLVTHGFVLDEAGRKMSKSIGNVLNPKDFIDGKVPFGVDVLRYWVSSTNYTSDVHVGPGLVSKVSDGLRKLRNTCRFILGNLEQEQAMQLPQKEHFPMMEQYMLHVLHKLGSEVTLAYDAFNFSKVYQLVAHFVATDLSAFYMEIVKDRLYCSHVGDSKRLAAQYVLKESLEVVTRAIAPICCHTAEDIFNHAAWMKKDKDDFSVFQTGWIEHPAGWENKRLEDDWKLLRQLRLEVNRIIELAREDKVIGSQLEVLVCLKMKEGGDTKLVNLLKKLQDENIEDLFLCSQVKLEFINDEGVVNEKDTMYEKDVQLNSTYPVGIKIQKAEGHKCPRCWKYCVDSANSTSLCSRCATASGIVSLEDIEKLVKD